MASSHFRRDEVNWLLHLANKTPHTIEKISILKEAAEKCSEYGFSKKEATICRTISSLCVQNKRDPKTASQYAHRALQIDPIGESFLCRARSLGYYGSSLSSDAEPIFAEAIDRYFEAFRSSINVSAAYQSVCGAIVLGLQKGMTGQLRLSERLKRYECVNLIKFIATTDECHPLTKCHVIKFLVVKSDVPESGVAAALSCNLSGFPWKDLLQEQDVNLEIVRAIVSLNGTISLREVMFFCADGNSEVMQYSIANSTQASADYNLIKLYEKAKKNKRVSFAREVVAYAVSYNVVSRDVSELCQQAIKMQNFNFIEDLIALEVEVDPLLLANKMRKADMQIRDSLNSYIMSTAEGCQLLLQKAVECSEFKVAADCLTSAEGEACRGAFDIRSALTFHKKANEDERQQQVAFIRKVLELGVAPNAPEGETSPLDVVLELTREYQSEKRELLLLLLQHGAAIERCTYQRKKGTTLIHEAIKYAIDSGDAMCLLEEVCKKFPYANYPDGKVHDNRGKSPYQLVMDQQKSPNTIKICEILSQYHIYPNVQLRDRVENNDKRYLIIKQVLEEKFTSTKKKSKEKNKMLSSMSLSGSVPTEVSGSSESQEASETSSKPEVDETDMEYVIQNVNWMLTQLSYEPPSYFKPPPVLMREVSQPESDPGQPQLETTQSHPPQQKLGQPSGATVSTEPSSSEKEKKRFDISDISSNFEGSSWEVECTDKVKKFFSSTKIPRHEKERVVKTIKKLVDGVPEDNPNLCKRVRSEDIKLYEAQYSKGSRIIFEFAVQFSPRLTSKAACLYCEVIRIWDIVRDHDKLNRSIDQVHKSIAISQSRGKTAAIRKPLKVSTHHKSKQSTQNQKKLRYPQYYIACDNLEVARKALEFIPAGSTKEDEYNVITFYSFDSSFVKSMLDGDNARRDFPFKEWPAEHDIINMPQGKVSILLLGRSGTGKTTCCLYRLWNQFISYWRLANDEPCFPQRPLAILQGSGSGESSESERSDEKTIESEKVANVESEETVVQTSPPAIHFHQVFITKNYVLCAQMKKRFYDLAAGSEAAKKHMNYEDKEIPTSLAKVDDYAFPLFLTARQFFILLDNSLQDNNAFFKRDDKGNLLEKIVSSDYDHENPDTLLDLEESDSEAEGDEESGFDFEDHKSQPTADEKAKPLQRREITASYFAEKIWPKISNNISLSDTQVDPLLVWMEIKSFIKGSMSAVEKEEGCLSLAEYELLGRKMASNYASKRSDIYKIFQLYKKYVKHRSDENLFDECDLNHSIYTRLNALKDLPWSIHNIYIDEVQDFTQAELSILIRICREPNDLFLTGDTAQSIMRGISFRFDDLRTIFHRAKEQSSKQCKSSLVEIPDVNELTINFRSHTGVLQLAASVIDLMKHFFPTSFDRVPGDEGMFEGPTPIVFQSCNVSDLAMVLRSNKREASAIEFGAHQVIIVQSEEAKKNIPDVLKAGIVLTVFEAKGLEFDDVLLYNFFKDSNIDKVWRVVASFTKKCCDKIRSSTFTDVPRELEFDESQHKSLNAELKYLYTAITRAKCNLWIYDSDEEWRLPMFHYWDTRGLVRVIQISEISEEDLEKLFSATSSEQEWKSQGDYFKKKQLWEPAMKCYKKAGHRSLEYEARAYSFAQQARNSSLDRTEINELYLRAAHAFLRCNQLQHDYQWLENAAKCLKNARQYRECSQLYLMFGQDEKALKGFIKAGDTEGLAKMKEKIGDYNGAIRVLRKHNYITEALRYAAKYENWKVKIAECYNVQYMASRYAERLSKPNLQNSQADLYQFEEVMKYLPPTERVRFYKACNMHERACDVLQSEKRYSDLFRIYKAKKWFEEGIQLSKSMKRRQDDEFTFILFKATAEAAQGLQENTKEMLKKITHSQTEIGAKAYLIYGAADQDRTMIKTAQDFYTNGKSRNSFGQIEAFNISVANLKYDDASQNWKEPHLHKDQDHTTSLLAVCSEIEEVTSSLENAPSSEITNQIEAFYGFEKLKVGETLTEMYFVPPSSYPWTNQFLRTLQTDTCEKDADGMLQLEISTVFQGLCSHLKGYIKKWIVDDELNIVEKFKEALFMHPLHQKIAAGGYLWQPYVIQSANEQNYFELLLNAFEFAHYGSRKVGDKNSLFQTILHRISPQATCYLPATSLKTRSNHLTRMMTEKFQVYLSQKDLAFNFNEWLEAWRMSCISNQSDWLKWRLNAKSQRFSQSVKTPILPIYLFHRGSYQHVISFWFKTCSRFHANLHSASCADFVHNILLHIASKGSILWDTLSLSNLLNMVTIHAVALLTMRAACVAHFYKQEAYVYFPESYKNVVDVFHAMNSWSTPKLDFHKACIHHIMTKADGHNLPSELVILLEILLTVMIGTGIRNQKFNPLKTAMSSEECLKNGEAKHCLIFVFTLFCNLGLLKFNTQVLHGYRYQIHESVTQCKDPLLLEICHEFLSSRTLLGCFGVTRKLLESSKDSLLQVHVKKAQHNNIENKFNQATFSPAYISSTPIIQQELIQISDHLLSKQSKAAVIRSSLRPEAEPFQPRASFTMDASQGLNQVKFMAQEESESVPSSPRRPPPPPPPPPPPSLPPPLLPRPLLTLDSVEDNEAEIVSGENIPPPLVGNSMHDYEMCKICGGPVEGISELESGDLEEARDLYHSHCSTEEHRTNQFMKERFDSEEKDYIQKKDTLLKLLEKCKRLSEFQKKDQEFQSTIDETDSDIKETDNFILESKNGADWQHGADRLRHSYLENLDTREMKLKRLIQRMERRKRTIEMEEKQETKDEEESPAGDLVLDEKDEKIPLTDTGLVERDKKRSRKSKRKRPSKR